MNLSEKNFTKIFNVLLLLIAVLMIFRKSCTIAIIIFAVYNLLFFKRLNYTKRSLWLAGVIASPLLLEIVLFWNNDSLSEGIKSLEKNLSLFVFALFILGNYQRVQFIKVIQYYSIVTTVLVLFFFIRFFAFYPELTEKYLNGTDLWEMGYKFADTLGIHAPALNMHLAFVAICNLYFVFYSFRIHEKHIIKLVRFIVFLSSFFFVLFVNTRMALFNALAGIVIVFFFEIFRNYDLKKVVIVFSTLFVLLSGVLYLFVQENPYMKQKYSSVTFAYMDKVGKLDEIENPEVKVFNALVTRVSIWKSAWDLSLNNLPFGVGAADGKPELFQYYKNTNQHFLAKYEFPTHNQFLDFLLKFGVLGPLVVLIYIFTIGYLGYDLKNAVIISFFFLFFTSNLTDDFLIRFDGIAFSGLWFSVFGSYWLQQKAIADKEQQVF